METLRSLRRRSRSRTARSGITLLEIAFTITILLITIASTSAASVSLSSLRRQNRERSLAHNAASALAERVHSLARTAMDEPGSWARNVVDGVCPPGQLGTSFDVKELTPLDGMAHVGSITFLADETRTDASLGVQLGLPRDLDGDGNATSTDVLATARLIPVVIELRWTGIRGEQRLVHPFYVLGY